MRTHLLPFLYLISSFLVTHAQTIKFGEIDTEAVKSTIYPKDSSAEAAVLYDFAEIDFSINNGLIYINMNYHGRIKIFKKSALNRASILLASMIYGHPKDEILSNIQGYTYNYVNDEVKRDKLTKEMIFTERASENLQTTKFTFPNVKEGSVIEYTYRLQTPLTLSTSPRTWTFQGELPVAWSEYKVSVPNYFYFRTIFSGYLPLHISETKPESMRFGTESVGGVAYRFVVKDAPAFINEPYITTPSDYVSKIDFELASLDIPGQIVQNFSFDYPSMNALLLKEDEFGLVLNKTSFMKEAARSILSKTKDTTEVIQAAVDYIQSKIRWNGNASMWVKNLKKVLEKGEGDAADINMTLICLLRELGFDAHPLILSTRDHGRIHEQYALRKRFNYVVAHIQRDNKDVLIDATDPFMKAGVLPTHCLNHVGWLVHPVAMRFIPIVPNERDIKYKKAELKLTEEGDLVGTLQKIYGGYSASATRTNFMKEGKDKFLANVKATNPSWSITKHEHASTTRPYEPFETTYDLKMSDQATVAGNMIYLKPMLTEGYTQNPFKSKERTFPIDLAYPIEDSFIAAYEIPAGYQTVEVPKSVAFNLPGNGGRFTFVASVTGNKVSINSRVLLRKDSYSIEEFDALKEFYDKIVAKHAEQIVIKKN
jgi:hypothetical protein